MKGRTKETEYQYEKRAGIDNNGMVQLLLEKLKSYWCHYSFT